MPYYLEHWDKHGFGWYSIFFKNDFVGRVGLFWNSLKPSQVELGYTIHEEYWGKGIATTASAFAIDHFLSLKITNEIVATIEDENPSSIRVAQKLGFKRVDDSDVFIEGNSHPLKLYRLVSKRSDTERRKQALELVHTVVQKMELCGLGMPRATVPLMPHNPRWIEAFLCLKTKLNDQLCNTSKPMRIEHFGSTCIPNIVAKPVLDVMLIFEDLEALEQSIRPLEELGFIYEGDAVSSVLGVSPDPHRHAFSYYNVNKDINYIYLHAYVQGHPDAIRNLKFRDKLLQDSGLAREYGLLKEAWRDSNATRREYSRAKGLFIRKVEGE